MTRIRLDRGELPWPPLVPGGEGLNRYPDPPNALRQRMAEVYSVPEECVLVTRGSLHGLDLIMRRARLDGGASVSFDPPAPGDWSSVAVRNGLEEPPTQGDVVVAGRPDMLGRVVGVREALDRAAQVAPAWLVYDERAIEFARYVSLALVAQARSNLVILRDLSAAYGLAGAPSGAIIANPATVARLAELVERDPIARPTMAAALVALSGSRVLATRERWNVIIKERARVASALHGNELIHEVLEGEGNWLVIRSDPRFPLEWLTQRYDLQVEVLPTAGDYRVTIGVPSENDLVITAFRLGDAPPRPPARAATIVRDTKETRIVAAVDLSRAEPVHIATGVGFFDHMLEQVARHGGFSLTLAVEGDLHIDVHHSIEDAALAFGEALRQALGDKAGVARFGFTAPLDEALAHVVIDLSGRPFLKFEGHFARPMIGDYPTELTAHVFRSIADQLRATIHVTVTGEDDHHKTEAAFKAFGRALRQAIRVEGDVIPSTKGVL